MDNIQLAYIAAAIARNRRAMRRYEAVYNAVASQQHENIARINGSDGLRPLHESAEAQNRMAIRIYGMAHIAPAAQMLPIIQAGWPEMVAAPVEAEEYLRVLRHQLVADNPLAGNDAMLVADYCYCLRTGAPHPYLDGLLCGYIAQRDQKDRRLDTPEARAWVRAHMGKRPAYDFWSIYDAGGNAAYTAVDAIGLAFELDGRSIDLALDGVTLTPQELAACAASAGLDMQRTQVNALVRLILRQCGRDIAASVADTQRQERACQAELQSSLADARAEIANLQATIAAQPAAQKAAEARAELAERRMAQAQEALAAVASERQELAALRTALHDALRDAPTPATEITGTTSLPDGIVIVGGITPWRRTMADRLGERATILSCKQALRVDPSVLRNASVIYIQTEHMSHSAYDRIQSARVNGVPPVRYFARVNVDSCIAQIISDAWQINA